MYFLNINKPKGLSSFDVIRELRKKLKTKQIGHSGTLDPLASGVLQIAVGKATKLLDYLDSDKIYVADLKFGYVTKTYDSEADKEFVKKPDFNQEQLLEVINSFVGITMQIPPVYSAIKVQGKKLCDLARNGNLDVQPQAREIEIYSIELLEYFNDFARIKVHCKKGTYIRSLVNDIGLKLGCGAYMSDLVRLQAGNFNIDNSDILDADSFKQINPLNALNIENYELNEEEYLKIQNGNFIPLAKCVKSDIVLLTKDNKLVSLAKISDNFIKPKKLFKEI